jgi:hypothetical protein
MMAAKPSTLIFRLTSSLMTSQLAATSIMGPFSSRTVKGRPTSTPLRWAKMEQCTR